MSPRPFLVLLALVALPGACSPDALFGGKKACTAIGCGDAMEIVLRPTGGVFPPGPYELFLATAEGGPARHCTFTVPPEGPGAFLVGDCVGDISVSLSPEVICTTTTHNGAITQSCIAVVGRFEQKVAMRGVTAQMRLIQRAQQGTFFDREITPAYQDRRPNGAECAPLCRQASLEASFSPDDRPVSPVACSPSACRRDADCAKVGPSSRCVQKPLGGPCVLYACE